MKFCGKHLCDACWRPVEPAYVGTNVRELCEACWGDEWSGLRIRGSLQRHQRLQPPLKSTTPTFLPDVSAEPFPEDIE